MQPSGKNSASTAWLPYVAPMAAFIALTVIEGYVPANTYVWLYIVKVFVVTIVLYIFRETWRDAPPSARVVPLAVIVGLLVFAQWVLLDKLFHYPHLSTRVGFDPFTAIHSPVVRASFLAARFYGLVLLVPLMEELFWRSFLLRYMTDADFKKIPIGTFSWSAFFIVAVAFSISHPEWLAAFICACAYALLLRHTRSLFAVIVAHSVTNLALGIYVIVARAWEYW
jgi:CAAX prenyl protease-like protein